MNRNKDFTVYMPAESWEAPLPLVAEYFQDFGLRARDFGPQVILAIWRDGRTVWSRDPLNGGPPYQTGRIAPQKPEELLGDLDQRGLFNPEIRNTRLIVLHDRFITISIVDGVRWLNLASSHEVHEANPEMVFTATALTRLEGHDRAAVLAAQPESHRRFRAIWGDLRQQLQALIPEEGQDAGQIDFKLQQLTVAE